MKKSILLFGILTFIFSLGISGQKPVILLSFSGMEESQWISLDSIGIRNITRGVDTMLYYPDTVLLLQYQVGIDESDFPSNRFTIFSNYPNPVKDHTTINMYIPDRGNAEIKITDPSARQVLSRSQMLDKGHHYFSFTPGYDPFYVFTANWNKSFQSIKIINGAPNQNKLCQLEYSGSKTAEIHYKSISESQIFSFDTGDDLIFIGYRSDLKSGIFDEPETDMFYSFQFATNIPCPEDSTIFYEGQTYHTIQIYSQCWLKENLNVGTKIPGSQDMEDNSSIEKYCFDDLEDNCDEYGGLYQWDEMMQYSGASGSQGICPPGWRIPTDDDWTILSGAVDSQFDFGDEVWYGIGNIGLDAGLNLKSTNGWIDNGNGTDAFGFSALPGGQRISNGYFDAQGYKASFWSSDEEWPDASWYRTLSYTSDGIDRSSQTSSWGKSVRCIKD